MTLENPDITTEQEEVRALVASLPREVTTLEHYELAASRLRDVKQRLADLDKLRKSMTRPMDDAKARVMALFRPIVDELTASEANLKSRMLTFQAREDARVAAEQVLVEQERASTEAAASAAVESGDYEDAMRLQEHRDSLPDPTPAYQRGADGYKPAVGTSTTTRWHAEVTDFPALVLAVAMGEQPIALLQVNQQALDALARATKGESTIPGVKFWGQKVLAATGRA